ncbi:MAG: V-type ATP synthase subunit E [Oscillospiraceae bacterium]|nr:V-type ATP synthase subunit E [Oscillospiraceae bacterium]
MQGLDTITGRIQSDAQAEIDRITLNAEQEAERIRTGYAAMAERESADILAKGRRAAEERGERLVSAAKMEAGKMTLTAKQDMLDRAFDLAQQRLLLLPEEDYVALLVKLVVAAASTGTEKLIFNQSDRTRFGVKVASQANDALSAAGKTGGITLSEQTRPIQGGVIVSDGAVEVNCALETLVRLARPEVAGQVSQLLFA